MNSIGQRLHAKKIRSSNLDMYIFASEKWPQEWPKWEFKHDSKKVNALQLPEKKQKLEIGRLSPDALSLLIAIFDNIHIFVNHVKSSSKAAPSAATTTTTAATTAAATTTTTAATTTTTAATTTTTAATTTTAITTTTTHTTTTA